MTVVFNSCAHPLPLIIALPGNLPGYFPDLPGLRLFDMSGNATRNGSQKRDRKPGFYNLLSGPKAPPCVCRFLGLSCSTRGQWRAWLGELIWGCFIDKLCGSPCVLLR